MHLVLLDVVVLGELVNTGDVENLTVCVDWLSPVNFITSQISISNKGVTWLVYIEGLWELLPSEVDGEGVSSVVREVDLSDLDGIVSQEVVEDILESLGVDEESKNLSVVIEELLLRWDSATSEFLLKVFKELLILLRWDWDA